MIYLTAFIMLSIPIVILAWKSLKNRKSHGFYRFFSWEAILVLIIFDIKYWFTNPFSLYQIFSWILLFISIWFVVAGTITLKKQGKQKTSEAKKIYMLSKKLRSWFNPGFTNTFGIRFTHHYYFSHGEHF